MQSGRASLTATCNATRMSKPLRHDLALIHDSLIEGKLPHNLSWSDTVEMIGQLGEVQPHGHDEFVFIVGKERAFFKHPHKHELGTEEVSRLRHFLRQAAPVALDETFRQLSRLIVVIDHHAAHVYQHQEDQHPDAETTVHPYDPHGFHHHLIHRKEANYKGERIPEEVEFYEQVAELLLSADEIVLIGHGTGKSSAIEYLATYLESHHPSVSRNVRAVESADLSTITEPQIEALAKRYMVKVV